MQKKYGARGFTVVSVSNDQTAKEAGAFKKEIKATFPVLHDPKNVVYEKFGVSLVPSNVVVDRSGKVVHVQESADAAKLDAAVRRALGR